MNLSRPRQDGSQGSVSASHAVGRGFASRVKPNIIIKWYKLPLCMARNALELRFDNAARLSKRPASVWNCSWGHALKRFSGINRNSRVSYPGRAFVSSAT